MKEGELLISRRASLMPSLWKLSFHSLSPFSSWATTRDAEARTKPNEMILKVVRIKFLSGKHLNTMLGRMFARPVMPKWELRMSAQLIGLPLTDEISARNLSD